MEVIMLVKIATLRTKTFERLHRENAIKALGITCPMDLIKRPATTRTLSLLCKSPSPHSQLA